MKELKNPHTRLFFFSVLLLTEIGLLIYHLTRGIHYSSWGDFISGQVFFNGILTLSFSLRAWRAYQETKKVKTK